MPQQLLVGPHLRIVEWQRDALCFAGCSSRQNAGIGSQQSPSPHTASDLPCSWRPAGERLLPTRPTTPAWDVGNGEQRHSAWIAPPRDAPSNNDGQARALVNVRSMGFGAGLLQRGMAARLDAIIELGAGAGRAAQRAPSGAATFVRVSAFCRHRIEGSALKRSEAVLCCHEVKGVMKGAVGYLSRRESPQILSRMNAEKSRKKIELVSRLYEWCIVFNG